MPTTEELKVAVKAAVEAEREEVKKAVEAAMAKGTVSDADQKEILDAIAGVYSPLP